MSARMCRYGVQMSRCAAVQVCRCVGVQVCTFSVVHSRVVRVFSSTGALWMCGYVGVRMFVGDGVGV